MLNKKVDQSLGDESVCDEANSKRGLACGQIGAFIHLISPTTSPSLPSYGTQRKRLHQYHLYSFMRSHPLHSPMLSSNSRLGA